MTFPWELRDDTTHLLASSANAAVLVRSTAEADGIPAFLRRDASNRAPFMDIVATKPQPQACTEPPLMPWSALPTTETMSHETISLNCCNCDADHVCVCYLESG